MATSLVLAAVVAIALRQSPTPATPEIATLDARLGSCSADFTVRDPAGRPVYAAMVQVRVRYGVMGIKRADLEVGTSAAGKARIAGLPAKAKPLAYDIRHEGRKAVARQDVARECEATFDVTLK
jgi:hypothetical protein